MMTMSKIMEVRGHDCRECRRFWGGMCFPDERILKERKAERDRRHKLGLRDSGQIEEAADNIFLIYRILGNGKYPEPFQDIPTKGTALITIGKGRNVGIGQFVCGFNPNNTLFYPLTNDDIEKLKFSNSIMGQSFSDGINEEAPF